MKNLDVIGEYALFLDGKEVHRQKNAMSVAGKNAAMRTLIGYQSRFANQMAIGIGDDPNVFDANSKFITNTRLDAEIDRIDINSAFVDTSEQYSKLIFKSSINKEERYLISELGLYSPKLTNAGNNQILLAFEGSERMNNSNLNINYITDTTKFSYKDNALEIPSNRTATYNQGINVTYQNGDDEINISYRKSAIFSSSINLRFYSSTNSISFLFTNSASGQVSQSQKISQGTVSGVFGDTQWRNITSVQIENVSNTGNNSIVMDLLRFNSAIDINNVDTALLSRVVLSTPIEKAKNEQLDIEYYLSLGFNEGI